MSLRKILGICVYGLVAAAGVLVLINFFVGGLQIFQYLFTVYFLAVIGYIFYAVIGLLMALFGTLSLIALLAKPEEGEKNSRAPIYFARNLPLLVFFASFVALIGYVLGGCIQSGNPEPLLQALQAYGLAWQTWVIVGVTIIAAILWKIGRGKTDVVGAVLKGIATVLVLVTAFLFQYLQLQIIVVIAIILGAAAMGCETVRPLLPDGKKSAEAK